MAEHINKTDTLNEGRVKLNEAISDSNIAKDKASQADVKSSEALANSESTQTQLDTIVIEGDSSVEAAQARVDELGEGHATLKARIDDGFEKASSQLAETESDIQSRGANILNYEHLAVGDDWSIPIQTIADEHNSLFIPDGVDVNFYETIFIENDFRIIGSGDGSALRFRKNSTAFAPKTKETTLTSNVVFKNFKLVGFGKTGLGIDLTFCDHVNVSGLNLSQFAVGIKLEQDSAKGYSRCHYNKIEENAINCTIGVHITGDKPNANEINSNRFSGVGTGVFVEIDRGAGKGPVNTLMFNRNNFFGVEHGIRSQYIVSSIFADNRFENLQNAIYWDKTSSGVDGTHRKLSIMSNHYGTNVNAWVGVPNLSSCFIAEGLEDLVGNLKDKFSFPSNIKVFGDIESTGNYKSNNVLTRKIVQKDVDTTSESTGRNQKFTHSTRIGQNKMLKIRLKAKSISMVNMKVVVVGNDGMDSDRLIGMEKSFMFGLGETSFTSLKKQTGIIETLVDTDVTLTHSGSAFEYDLIVKNSGIRNHSTTVNVEMTNSRFFTDLDGSIEFIKATLVDIE